MPHLHLCYDKYPTLFYFILLLIRGHLMTTQLALLMIIFTLL